MAQHLAHMRAAEAFLKPVYHLFTATASAALGGIGTREPAGQSVSG